MHIESVKSSKRSLWVYLLLVVHRGACFIGMVGRGDSESAISWDRLGRSPVGGSARLGYRIRLSLETWHVLSNRGDVCRHVVVVSAKPWSRASQQTKYRAKAQRGTENT